MNDLILKVWCRPRQRNIQHFLIDFWSMRKVVFIIGFPTGQFPTLASLASTCE
jgi:hypothetical protein